MSCSPWKEPEAQPKAVAAGMNGAGGIDEAVVFGHEGRESGHVGGIDGGDEGADDGERRLHGSGLYMAARSCAIIGGCHTMPS